MGTLLSPHQERSESSFSNGQEDPNEQGLRVDLPSIGGGKVLQVQLLEPSESVRTLKHPLEPIWKEGELFVIAGDNKESAGDAWFLVIASPRPESKKTPMGILPTKSASTRHPEMEGAIRGLPVRGEGLILGTRPPCMMY